MRHGCWRWAATAAFVVSALAGCSPQPEAWQQESFVFGTRVVLTVYDADHTKAQAAMAQVLGDLDQLHQRLHAWQAAGEVHAANQAIAAGEPFKASPELDELITLGQQLEQQSGQLFSPAIGAMVAAWGFHADQYAARLPAAQVLSDLASARPRMADLLRQPDGRWLSRNPAVQLDFGGMAKGWALDRSRAMLLKAGISSALLNIGGNIIALGSKPGGEPWRVGLRHPRQADAMATLALADGEAVGTSGDYQRFFQLQGRRYCHLIDPRDAQSRCQVQSVSVLSRAGPHAGLLSDVASKPLYFAGPAAAAGYASRFGLAGWLLIDSRGEAWLPQAFDKRLQWPLQPTRIHHTG
ncbi:FAD:protein FMN transferase [Vogesella mureinivorans]|uniref:FAD:protein FMN transferase n=1 Tax=Vogesella mureinivorans TaxID=657276 RepID=UPI0011C8CF33|nr:FAD:protein FMN transferase [Vogesella mureinivorans]